jgi:hypothetical protein
LFLVLWQGNAKRFQKVLPQSWDMKKSRIEWFRGSGRIRDHLDEASLNLIVTHRSCSIFGLAALGNPESCSKLLSLPDDETQEEIRPGTVSLFSSGTMDWSVFS